MNILPAIDLYDKKVVRLVRGDYSQMTVYSDNPVEIAGSFASAGANWLHTVDLEGAENGTTPNIDTVAELVKSCPLKVEVGGGIRSEDTIKKYLGIGVSRVIIGTAAVTDRDFLERMSARYGNRLAVGVDLKDGMVAIKGWKEKSGITGEDFFNYLDKIGIGAVICTDISKDGMLSGTNTELYGGLCKKYSMEIIASGGVTTVDDVRVLKGIGVSGAIIGKALYTGAINLAEAVKIGRGES